MLISFQASVSSNRQLSFQCSYASLRAEMFQAHSLLLASCATMKSCPPPAIATAVAMATGQDVQRLSHFATQVSLSGKEGDLDSFIIVCTLSQSIRPFATWLQGKWG